MDRIWGQRQAYEGAEGLRSGLALLLSLLHDLFKQDIARLVCPLFHGDGVEDGFEARHADPKLARYTVYMRWWIQSPGGYHSPCILLTCGKNVYDQAVL